jgi:uncharacterized iron-regulated membrane protein
MMAALRKLHAWAGLVLCLLLVPLALSGAALVFKPEWIRATTPGAAGSVTVDPAAAAQAMAAAGDHFGKVRSVVFAGPEVGLHQVYLKEGGGYVSQDGALVQRWGKNERAVDWLFDLHHHLLAGETGQFVAGVAGIAALLMVITGLILILPAVRSFAWRIAPTGRPGRAGWLSAHRDLSLIAAPALLVLIATGTPVALGKQTSDLLRFEKAKPPAVSAAAPDWPAVFAAAQARFPDAVLRSATPPAQPGKTVMVRLRQPAEWHANGRTVVHLDPADGRIVAVEDALAHPLRQRIYNAFWPLHASKVGGLVWKVVSFLAGLALAALSIYGAEAYRRKLFRPAATAKRRRGVGGPAAATPEG